MSIRRPIRYDGLCGELRENGLPEQRVEGDGAAMRERQKEQLGGHNIDRDKPFSLVVELDMMQIMVFVLSLATRLWRLEFPRAIVFDEVHFGRFAMMYRQGVFFFDVHPPLGKLLLASVAYFMGYEGDFNFDKIGTEYSSEVPLVALRLLPALAGSLLIPLVYYILVLMNLSRWTAALGSTLLLCDNAPMVQSQFLLLDGFYTSANLAEDNALMVQSQFMLLDSFLLFFLACALLAYLKFKSANVREPFSVVWWCWLAALGLMNTCAILTKYSAFLTVSLLLVLVAKDLWEMLPSRTLHDVANNQYHTFWCPGDECRQGTNRCDIDLGFPEYSVLSTASVKQHKMALLWHLWGRACCLCFAPVILYISVFYLHLSLLYKAGPHDSTMTSAFQASLQGGLAAITRGQPLVVAYGSQITLRHTYGQPCWLHSHQHVYPIRYPDKRGSSHQQQVTCYTFKDINNWWIIKDPTRNTMMVDDPLRPVKDGDVVQLVHGLSSRALNSHDVAAPMSPQNQEVSCYIDYNISVPAQNLWKVEILNAAEEGDTWHTIQSHVRLVHYNTTQALKVSGKQLPDWGFFQFEVVTDRILNQESTVWNVEEHRYTQSPNDEDRTKEMQAAEMIPTEPTHLSFVAKFWELQVKMLMTRHDAELEHYYSSGPLEWPLMDRNIAYWANASSTAQIHLLGNPFLWGSGTLVVIIYIGLGIFYLMRRRRRCYDISQDDWCEFIDIGALFLAGYMVNLVPYTALDRTLFLHHYLPALMFKIMLIAGTLEHGYKLCRTFISQSVYLMLVIVWLTGVVNTFLAFLPLSYGSPALTSDQIQALTWRESWDFFQQKVSVGGQ